MTTLPQTTGARFPRAGARAPSIPALSHPGAAAGAPGSNALTLTDVMRVLRTNLLLIVTCFVLSLIIGFLVNKFIFVKYMQQYTAQVWLQVQTPAMIDPNSNVSANTILDRQLLEIRQKTLAQKLQSPDLWLPIFQNAQSPLVRSQWIQSFQKPGGGLDVAAATQEIQDNLSVNPQPTTELISASLSAPTAKDAQVVLKALTDKLIDNENLQSTESTTDEKKALTQLQLRIDGTLNNLNAQINDLSSRLNQGQTADGSGNGIATVQAIKLQGLVGEQIKAAADFEEAQSTYQTFIQDLDAGKTPAMLDQVMQMNMTLRELESMVTQSELNVDTMIAINGPEHRSVKVAQASAESVKAKYEAKRDGVRVETGEMLRGSLLAKAQAAKSNLDAITSQIQKSEPALGELQRDTFDLATKKDQKKYLDDRKEKIESRLGIIEANQVRAQKSRGSVAQVYDIKEPQEPSFPNLKLTLGVAGLLGLCLSLGIAFLREMMDTTVRSPRDITKVGQLNLLGMIPHVDDDPQAAAGDLSLAISQSPHSIIAENFRQVRTRLQHAASLDTTRSLLVTSPGPGDGKTTVACNIAAGLALNGRKILLVDANFRRPELHKVFGVANEAGFGNVLTQQGSVESLAQKTQVPNLSVLTTGPRPANPTELLESQLLTDFIDRTLEEYDHVIFDCGPILLVSETVALAPRVDGVVTVVRAKANSRGLLQRMRDALRQLKAEHLGVVLNGVRQHTGGYYGRNIKNYYAYSNGNH